MTRSFQSVVAALMMSGPAIAQDQPADLAGQLAFLNGIGIELSPGITTADLTLSFSATDFLSEWPGLLLFTLGSEVESPPWGRRMSPDVWAFDFESIYEPTDYQTILANLVGLTDQPDILTRNASLVDFDNGQAVIDYQIGTTSRNYTAPVDGDWADAAVFERMMRDIAAATPGSGSFWFMDNGQGMVLMFLDPQQAAKLNALQADIIIPAS